eukprot:SAG25_NODE_955_length_4560_cov_121.642009_4_plen_44_part_00
MKMNPGCVVYRWQLQQQQLATMILQQQQQQQQLGGGQVSTFAR